MADHLGTVAGIYEAFGRGDAGWILDQLDDDVSWDEGIRDTGLAYLRPGRGKAHVAEFFTNLMTTLEFTQFEVGPLCDGGDTVLVPIRSGGRIVGGGELVVNDYAHQWGFGPDGKVTLFRHIADWQLHEQAAMARSAGFTGRTFQVVGDEIEVLGAGDRFEVFRLSGPEGSGPPPHSHPWTEAYYGLSGTVTVTAGDTASTLEVGGFVSIPAGTLHSYRIESETAAFVVITSGHRASAFFADVDASVPAGPPTGESLPTLIEVAMRNGLSSPLFA